MGVGEDTVQGQTSGTSDQCPSWLLRRGMLVNVGTSNDVQILVRDALKVTKPAMMQLRLVHGFGVFQVHVFFTT